MHILSVTKNTALQQIPSRKPLIIESKISVIVKNAFSNLADNLAPQRLPQVLFKAAMLFTVSLAALSLLELPAANADDLDKLDKFILCRSACSASYLYDKEILGKLAGAKELCTAACMDMM